MTCIPNDGSGDNSKRAGGCYYRTGGTEDPQDPLGKQGVYHVFVFVIVFVFVFVILPFQASITIDEPASGSNERVISIVGTPKQIQTAQYLLQQSVREHGSAGGALRGGRGGF